jgi:uncharacterized protein involved in type VI secretion and phage assembly
MGTADPSPMAGVARAIVRANRDSSGQGRVLVSFPWHANPDETYWARVALPSNARTSLASFVPDVNDEVLVAFEHGDVRSPVIVGNLWNGTDRPPSSATSTGTDTGTDTATGTGTGTDPDRRPR